ncbi:MAG: N-acetylgalactosamine-6-sulfatase [Planctomycetota bacterium]|nr:MAG: N-acetylgalactosamine-6-sulfatase [Planctomycetota bacterium]
MRQALLPLLLAALSLSACQSPSTKAERPPNIILILADDLGYGELGSYGQSKIRTPHLDRLAAEGMRLRQHYSGSPVCAPSRCTLLTGLHTGHAFIRDNDEMGHRGDVWRDPALEGQRPLPPGTQTLGHALQAAGYRTAAVGKWGLGWVGSSGEPSRQGFDLFFGYNCQRQAHNYYPTHLWKNAEKVPLGNPVFFPHQKFPEEESAADPAAYQRYQGSDYAPDHMIEEALQFIRENRDQPFFLYYPSPIPHLALQIPPSELQAYLGEFEEEPYLGDKGYLPHPAPRAAYAAMISRLDAEVGRMLALLDQLELENDTLVVFTSDNGPSWVGGVDREFFQSSGGLRGRKGQLFEGGIRVPCIVRWPGKVEAGSQSDHLSAFWDFFPTLAEVAGAETPKKLDGISMLPTWLGNPERQQQHEYLYWEYARRFQAMRMGNWKAYRPRPSADLQLYDLEADPNESHDLAAEHPERVERFTQLMETARSRSEHFPLKP